MVALASQNDSYIIERERERWTYTINYEQRFTFIFYWGSDILEASNPLDSSQTFMTPTNSYEDFIKAHVGPNFFPITFENSALIIYIYTTHTTLQD